MIQAATEGLAYGGLYMLLGLGFFLTFRVLRRIDLAYGTMIMASLYVAAMIVSQLDLHWLLVPVISLVIGLPLAMVIAWLCFILISEDARFSMAATLGVWMAIDELILQSPGRGRGQPVANPLQTTLVDLLGIRIRIDHLLLLVSAVVVILVVRQFLLKTRTGLAIRTVAHDPVTASLLGMSPRVISFAATALSAAVGVFAGWAFALSQSGIDLHFGMWATIKGLVILVLSGAQSFPLIVVAALALGIGERLGSELIGAGYRDLFGYGLILALLIIGQRAPMQSRA
jgi:branched-chain amino acid transport system permease protein